ncbi:hypothetical protein C4565_05350, partial [Candidatus Parcubacteria bacterium]
GGAAALSGLLCELSAAVEVVCCGRPPALKALGNVSFEVLDCISAAGPGPAYPGAGNWFKDVAPDVLLTDTVNLIRCPESVLLQKFWRLADDLGIPSFAYVDCWWGYGIRFLRPGERTAAVMPYTIAVADDIMKTEMIEEGFDAKRIQVLGNPRFERLLNQAQPNRKTARRNLGLMDGEKLLVHASQPATAFLGSDVESTWGFSEFSILRWLLEGFERLDADERKVTRLVVKPHPEEDIEPLLDIVASASQQGVVAEVNEVTPMLELVEAADLVTGINSILLLEALILGVPAVSLQPNLKREDMLLPTRIGAMRLIIEPREIPELVERLVRDQSFGPSLLEARGLYPLISDATKRWKQALFQGKVL